MKLHEVDPRAALVGGLCAYEIFALTTGRAPTITKLCWRLRGTWAGRIAVWTAGGVLMHHLLVESDVVQGVVDTISEALP